MGSIFFTPAVCFALLESAFFLMAIRFRRSPSRLLPGSRNCYVQKPSFASMAKGFENSRKQSEWNFSTLNSSC
jgi:hypothetical protein